jgi:exodeoxyribonuclease-3
VVVGVAQSYGHPRTIAMLNGLEVIPPRILTYQGLTFEELDVEALIKRHPERALVDELAHTNVPGSRRAKRWEDVLDVLAAGIAVITTVNVQHLASLNDLVARIIGIRQQETVPDWVLELADQVELVDMSPYALQRRMVHGNVYPNPGKADPLRTASSRRRHTSTSTSLLRGNAEACPVARGEPPRVADAPFVSAILFHGGYCGLVRIATWNVNSVKQRVPRLLPWLDQRQPDVVCLQETKLGDEAFTELLGEELAGCGYGVALHGEVQWNGVAILSKVGLDDVVAGVPGGPGFPRQEARAVSATCGGIRVYSVYAPNGRVPDSDHYRYKLAWLAALREMVGAGPQAAIVCGDMNIAPTDADVFDPEAYVGQTHVTPPERAALAELQALGLRDVVRDRWPAERVFTYWDYRAGMFHRDLGMRIDLVLASAPVAGRVRAAWVDRQARKGSGPSDHAPVIVDLDEAPDGDIGPVVPPPSAPAAKRGSAKLPQSR